MHRSQWSEILEKRKVDFTLSKLGNKLSAFDVLQVVHFEVPFLDGVAGNHFRDLVNDRILADRLKIEATYEPFKKQQQQNIEEIQAEEWLQVPHDLDFNSLSMSKEVIGLLNMAKPTTIGAARRIKGMTPGALLQLMWIIKKHERQRTRNPSLETS